ncbi:class I SAM-dependent methyltransferase [Mycoplasmatota bacterium WC30]
MEKLKKFLENNPQAKILDVGTGRGNFIGLIDHLYKDYEKIVGIDILGKAVEMASKYFEDNGKIEIIEKDIINTGFPKEHFDIVCLSNSLHHLDDILGRFKSMETLVKPGGYLLFNEMMKDNLNKKQISHKLIHHFSAKLDREMGMTHNDTYNRQEIIDVIKANSKFDFVDAWDMEVPTEDASKAEIEGMIKTVDMLLSRLNDEKLIMTHTAEAEEIKQYIKENGIQACTQLLVVLKKA